jgi:acyl carrier protein
MTDQDIAAVLETFVREIGRVSPDDADFTPTTDLFDGGYLDSLAIVALGSYLEESFGVVLGEQDLFDPRITTLQGLVALVVERRSGDRLAPRGDRGEAA